MEELKDKADLQVRVKQAKHAEIKEQKSVFRGRTKLRKGMKFYKLNCKTGVISEVEIKKSQTIHIDGSKEPMKVELEDNHLYLPALNIKNAKRKFVAEVNKIVSRNEKNNSNSI